MKMNSKIQSYYMLKLKCPRCYKGDLFINPGLFVMTRFLKMHEKCKKCNQDFRIEPEFYSTALWIGFPIVLIVFIPLLFFGLYLNEYYGISLKVILPIFLILCFLLQIPIMRISRAILLHLTFKYFGWHKKE
ncbi:DUF983 domain-containing protein [Flavobacterium johnsoniae]|uniref:DUF983 domain-containing protein n=2 Tax=Flavobacterium johnsoniae TaxID=986 RepID=A5FBG0_FLAJ1|nr:DUF983 domain-containing protein [Flavobacterium johnsoniae]ABQ07458.1 hypothetical protein Fjoh_4455 [Flavobacterium johnsoniae UW101]OXE99360.1 DUF983 domain-containing protein [Flavobacterium johnsoniae UW101]